VFEVCCVYESSKDVVILTTAAEIKDMWLGKAKPKAEAAKAEVEPAT
jgi:hypothetical protein